MFWIAATISLVFVLWGILFTDNLAAVFDAVLWNFLVPNFGWVFILSSFGFLAFSLYLAFSRYGKVRLGGQNEQPEFRTVSWIAMMFSAGMGIGLMFFGVAEPLSHMSSPPAGTAEAGTREAAQVAMEYSYFHWAFHPWAIYAVMGLALAYFCFRKGMPNLISTAFYPLLGDRVYGPIGKTIDILAIFATLFGSAASLGLGALQIGAGIEFAGWMGNVTTPLLVAIIAVLTVAFIASAVSGVAKGIQWLSNINMVLALALAAFVFVAGPTVFMLDLVPTAVGSYFQELAAMSARTDASGGDGMATWLSGWTVFYWAWWLSWTPFVGMFIARISRGRTIRQFVTGVLLVPSLVSLVWFAIFGGAAIKMQQDGVDLAGASSAEGQLFAMLGELPLATITSVLVMILVAIFFVSGADAASIVMGSLSQRGALEPGRATVIFWGVATGGVAAVMLLVGGDSALTGLQNITIVAALPFALVMVGLAVALVKDLHNDPLMVRRRYAREMVEQAVVTGVTRHGDDFALTVEPSDEPVLAEGDTTPSRSGDIAR